MAIARPEEIEKAKKEEKKLEARIFKVSIDETGEKEIPATNLNTTLAHDVIHELALVTDRRGLIRAHDFRQAVFKFKDTDASKKMLCVGEIILNRLLYTFGKPYGGLIDFCDIAGAIIEVSGGTADHRCGLAFQIYDYEMKGEISKHELRLYLHSVYTLAFCMIPRLRERYNLNTLVDIASEIAMKESDDTRIITLSAFDIFYGTGILNWTAKDLSDDHLSKIQEECKFMMKKQQRRGRTATRDSRGRGRDNDRSRSRSRSHSPDDSVMMTSDDEGVSSVSSLSHRALFYALKGVDSPSDSRKRMHRSVVSVTKIFDSLSIGKACAASRR